LIHFEPIGQFHSFYFIFALLFIFMESTEVIADEFQLGSINAVTALMYQVAGSIRTLG
jgi:hypothetical protein